MRRTLGARREAIRQNRANEGSGSRLVLPLIALACFLLYAQLSGGGSAEAAAGGGGGGGGDQRSSSAAASIKLATTSSSSSPRDTRSGSSSQRHAHHRDRKIAAGTGSYHTSFRSSMAASDAAAAALRASLLVQATAASAASAAAATQSGASSSSSSSSSSSASASASELASAAGAGAALAAVKAQQPLAAAGGADEVVRRAATSAAEAVVAEKAAAAATANAAAVAGALRFPSADSSSSAAAAASSAAGALGGSSSSSSFNGGNLPLPAIATDRRAQPLAEPASSDAAAEATFLAATLRDPVDPLPPAGSGTSSPDEARRLAVRSAMAHSWAGYVANAWGADELAPVSKHGYETFCSLGATLVDSLDTLWIMGFKKEFERAKEWVVNSLTFKPPNGRQCGLSVFESTIRVLGGLLAAHDLSGETAFVAKAEELARALEPAYDTPLFFPRSEIELQSGKARTPSWIGGGQSALLAEIGTVQMELIALSAATGNSSWAQLGERVIETVDIAHYGTTPKSSPFVDAEDGLLPIYVSLDDASAAGTVTIGAMADSYYEYLLKVWVQKGKVRGERYRAMWERSMDSILKELVATSEAGGHVYVGEKFSPGGAFNKRMEHLTCFVAGNLALGVMHGAVADPKKADRYLEAAKGITETCYNMYKLMPSGLAPEYVRFDTGVPGAPTMVAADNAPYNLLRPEAVEALFMLYRATGDQKYREWGWEMFQSFEKHCKVPGGGYSGLLDVRESSNPRKNDKQESFWLAETLKYFYLLFSPESALPLDKFVLNTEAHPLRVLSKEDAAAVTSDFGASSSGVGRYYSAGSGSSLSGGSGSGSGGRDSLLADVAAKLASGGGGAASKAIA